MKVINIAAILALVVATSFVTPAARAENLPIDFKILVDLSKSNTILQDLGFSRLGAEKSNIYFFDTKDLKLFGAGLFIRARDNAGAGGEVMVKARPLEVGDLDESWYDVAGLGCEIDATPLKAIPSCSVRIPTNPGAIAVVVGGRQDLDYIMTPDQEFFANDFGGYDSVRARVKVWGPIAVWRWRVPNPSGWRVFAEYWLLPSGAEFVELSIQGMSTDSLRLEAALRTIMRDRKLDPAAISVNKTASALKALTR